MVEDSVVENCVTLVFLKCRGEARDVVDVLVDWVEGLVISCLAGNIVDEVKLIWGKECAISLTLHIMFLQEDSHVSLHL